MCGIKIKETTCSYLYFTCSYLYFYLFSGTTSDDGAERRRGFRTIGDRTTTGNTTGAAWRSNHGGEQTHHHLPHLWSRALQKGNIFTQINVTVQFLRSNYSILFVAKLVYIFLLYCNHLQYLCSMTQYCSHTANICYFKLNFE